ncbi:pyridoxal-phosphate dependent enzyme [bacterium]|nr:MAG: pyridoxal-phosphate dependent enzyme [bacterium]
MNIWKYQNNYKYQIEKEFQLELDETNTNFVTNLNAETLKEIDFELDNLVFWNETINPTNSFKDRSLLYQISYYFQQFGSKDNLHFAISSSGNAAIAAANICKKYNIKLDIFVSDKLNIGKLEKLNNFKSEFIQIHQSSKAKSDCVKFCNENQVLNLRASEDDIAIEGYKSLAYDIFEQNLDFDSIFITCSSGTATLGIYEGMKEKLDLEGHLLPQFHIIQTPVCRPIASNIIDLTNKELGIDEEGSLVTCVVDKVAKRKDIVTKLVLETSGTAWIVDNEDLEKSKASLDRLSQHLILEDKANILNDLTWNALSSFAGTMRAKEKGWDFKNPLIIISGI